jgi:hypothetical protein
MAAKEDDVARVQLLLNELFLSRKVPRDGVLGHAPLGWIAEWLGLAPSEHFGEEALRHLVAIQLAPRGAIAYDPANPAPRWKLIDGYLARRFRLSDADRVPIARAIASTLDVASLERGATLLAAHAASKCAICRLPFQREPLSVSTRDAYKPTWQAPEELCRPEVDHVVPISSLGAHAIKNLQIVCRACNMAKGGGLLIDPDAEIRYSAVGPAHVPRVHLFRLLQWLIRRNSGRCERCADETAELTMRPGLPDAPIARTTLNLVCYECASAVDGNA